MQAEMSKMVLPAQGLRCLLVMFGRVVCNSHELGVECLSEDQLDDLLCV